MTKIHIQYQDQVGAWKHYTTKHHQGDAYGTAANRAKSPQGTSWSEERSLDLGLQ